MDPVSHAAPTAPSLTPRRPTLALATIGLVVGVPLLCLAAWVLMTTLDAASDDGLSGIGYLVAGILAVAGSAPVGPSVLALVLHRRRPGPAFACSVVAVVAAVLVIGLALRASQVFAS